MERYSVAHFARPAHTAMMKRLEEGDLIPPLEEGVVEEDVSAEEWHYKMSVIHRAKNS